MSDTNDKYYHWALGENILREDSPTYLINLEHGVSIRIDYADSYFATFEDFKGDIADVQFLSGTRPDQDTVDQLLIDAWNFLAHFERKEEAMANERDLDDDYM